MVFMPDMDVFDPLATRRPDAALFYSRHDANDVRLGDLVRSDPTAYTAANVVVLGCPQDEGVRRNGGRPGAAAAPAEIRRCLYRLTINHLPTSLRLFDLGDTQIQPALEETHALQLELVSQVLRDGKRLIVLGGGNDISFPDVAGLARVARELAAFNIDTHFDVRAGDPRNSGTPYRQLLAGGLLLPGRFHEIGYQPFANSPVYEQYLRDLSARLISLADLRAAGVGESIRRCLADVESDCALFWGFDLDVVCAADAPGVSAPNPVGLRGDELCQIAAIAGTDPRTRVVEFSEVNPTYDLDLRTSRLTAVAIWHYLSNINTYSSAQSV
jgi:formiminoglutamase